MPLFALESRRPARDFDVVGFSLQYELLATNVAQPARPGGHPDLEPRARAESDPFVAAGGPCEREPRAAGRLLRPLPDRRRRGGGRDGSPSVSRATRGRPRRERLRALAPRSRASTSRAATSRSTTDGRHGRRAPRWTARRSRCAGPMSSRWTRSPTPSGRSCRLIERGAGPAHARDPARLHAGLPLLPGGHLLPARARAQPETPDRAGRQRPRGVRATTRSASRRSPAPTTRRSCRWRARWPRRSNRARTGISLPSLRARHLQRGAGRARRARAEDRAHLRPRGGHAAAARRDQQERRATRTSSPRSRPPTRAAGGA